MKTPAILFRAARLALLLMSVIAVTTVGAHADVHGQSRPRPAKERRPNVFERIGNFFYNLANGLERSDMPDHPGRGPSKGRRNQVAPTYKPVPDPNSQKQGVVDPTNRAVTPAPSGGTVPLPDAAAAGSDRKSTAAAGLASPDQGKAAEASAKRPDQSQEKDYPTATPSRKFGRVKSPYSPFTELDVTGLPSGSLAKDPVTGRIFRLP